MSATVLAATRSVRVHDQRATSDCTSKHTLSQPSCSATRPARWATNHRRGTARPFALTARAAHSADLASERVHLFPPFAGPSDASLDDEGFVACALASSSAEGYPTCAVDFCEVDWDGLADPAHAWNYLLAAEPAPFARAGCPLQLASFPAQPDTKFVGGAHDLTLHGASIIKHVQSELAWRLRQNSSAVTWRHLLKEATESESKFGNGLLGAFLYGVGDVASQILDHHQATEFNMMELGGIMLLGVLMEGVIQPYWSSMIKERIKSAHDVSLPRVQALEFFLQYIVWTPLVCEFYLAYQHLLVNGGPDWREYTLLLDGILGTSFISGDAAEAEAVVELVAEGIMDEVGLASLISVGASALIVFVPAPLRPLVLKIFEAGSWTLV